VNAAPGAAPSRLADLFASAVHRFGAVWADLLVASLAILFVATLPVAAAELTGSGPTVTGTVSILSYAIGYFVFVAFVMLRGLPRPAPPAGRRDVRDRRRHGILAGAILKVLATFVVVVLPFLLFAVPSVAAGDVEAAVGDPGSSWRRAACPHHAVWLITMVFSLPVLISMFLVVSAFADGGTAVLRARALGADHLAVLGALRPALYGDLTGRVVVAPQDAASSARTPGSDRIRTATRCSRRLVGEIFRGPSAVRIGGQTPHSQRRVVAGRGRIVTASRPGCSAGWRRQKRRASDRLAGGAPGRRPGAVGGALHGRAAGPGRHSGSASGGRTRRAHRRDRLRMPRRPRPYPPASRGFRGGRAARGSSDAACRSGRPALVLQHRRLELEPANSHHSASAPSRGWPPGL
jgi:hypothetical protein